MDKLPLFSLLADVFAWRRWIIRDEAGLKTLRKMIHRSCYQYRPIYSQMREQMFDFSVSLYPFRRFSELLQVESMYCFISGMCIDDSICLHKAFRRQRTKWNICVLLTRSLRNAHRSHAGRRRLWTCNLLSGGGMFWEKTDVAACLIYRSSLCCAWLLLTETTLDAAL